MTFRIRSWLTASLLMLTLSAPGAMLLVDTNGFITAPAGFLSNSILQGTNVVLQWTNSGKQVYLHGTATGSGTGSGITNQEPIGVLNLTNANYLTNWYVLNPATHTGSTYTAGTGITIAGTVISLYTPPSNVLTADITSAEYGQTVSSVALSWTTNAGSPTNLWFTNPAVNVTVSGSPYTDTSGYTSAKTWRLLASDGRVTNSATASLTFYYRGYWGFSSNTTLAATGSGSVTNLGTNAFKTSGTLSTISLAATPSQYFFYAYPAAWSEVTLYFNNFAQSGTPTTTNSVTNAYGTVTSYRVARSLNPIESSIPFYAQ